MIHIKIHSFGLKDLNGIYSISQTLAHFFPKPEESTLGIYELLLNAVEHGNLGIGFEEKTSLLREGKWHEEIARRLALPEYASKEVDIKLAHNERECRLSITDQGQGFPWKNYVGRPIDDQRPNGRGLLIAFNSSFNQIVFNTVGNEVTCAVKYAP